MEKNIELIFSFDANYITPFLVLLASVFANNVEEEIYFHIGLTNASAQEKARITEFVEANRSKVWFYNIDIEQVRAFAPPSERYGLYTFYRLLLPSLLPERVEKIIYLDVDLLIVGSLRQLYDTDIGTLPVAAVPEPVTFIRSDLGLQKLGDYFNAGVLLINMHLWRQQQIAEKTIQYLKDYPEKVEYLDQDALNAVLVDNWLPLEDAYNFTWRAIPPQASQRELQQLVACKTIVHFNTAAKPWHRMSAGRLDYLYHDFFDKLPYPKLQGYHQVVWNANTIGHFIKLKLLKFYWDNPNIGKFWRKIKSDK